MFTGIITEIGTVKSLTRKGSSARLEISCVKTAEGVGLGDSVAVNGACLSVVGIGRCLAFDVVGNTLDGTNIKGLKRGDPVNLENALKLGDTISGHMVTGHVDGERTVRSARTTPKGLMLEIALLPDDARYVLPKGSIAVDGASLTAGEVCRDTVKIFLIPHTLENTTLKKKKSGDRVNVEFDMNAKYAARGPAGGITEGFLREKGYI